MKRNIPYNQNYFLLLKQIRLHGFIASRELEKSEFNSVDRYNINLTNKVPIQKLVETSHGEATAIKKYSEYVKYKVESIALSNDNRFDFFKKMIINNLNYKDDEENSSYLVAKMEILNERLRKKRFLNRHDLVSQNRINKEKAILSKYIRLRLKFTVYD